MNSKLIYIKSIPVILLLTWCFGIFFPVLFHNSGSFLFSHIFLDKIYSLVCHQQNSKSFFISGDKLEVCARCTGIYCGALIFSIPALIFPKLKPGSKNPLYISMAIMAADVILYSSGVYSYSKWIAFFTGLILGSVSILYIFTGIEDFFSELKINSNVQ